MRVPGDSARVAGDVALQVALCGSSGPVPQRSNRVAAGALRELLQELKVEEPVALVLTDDAEDRAGLRRPFGARSPLRSEILRDDTSPGLGEAWRGGLGLAERRKRIVSNSSVLLSLAAVNRWPYTFSACLAGM